MQFVTVNSCDSLKRIMLFGHRSSVQTDAQNYVNLNFDVGECKDALRTVGLQKTYFQSTQCTVQNLGNISREVAHTRKTSSNPAISTTFVSSPRPDNTVRRQRVHDGLKLFNDVAICRYIDPDLSKDAVRRQLDLEKELGLDLLLPKSTFFRTFHSTHPLNRDEWAARCSIRCRRST